MSLLGNLVVNIGANTSGFTRGFNSIQNAMTKGKLKRGSGGTSLSGRGIGGDMSAKGLAGAVVQGNLLTSVLTSAYGNMRDLVSQSIILAAQTEQTRLTFEVLSGSKPIGDALFGEMEKIAKDTTLSLAETTSAARQLLVTFDATQIPHLVKMLGNISSGMDNVSLNEMAFLLQTSAEEGKLLARDLRQFTTRGIAMPKALKEVLGLFGPGSSAKLNAMISAGQVGFGTVMKAIEKLGSTNMLARQGRTLTGRFNQMRDGFQFLLRDVGEMIVEAFDLKGSAESITAFLRSVQDNLWTIKPVVMQIGAAFWSWVKVIGEAYTVITEFLGTPLGKMMVFVTVTMLLLTAFKMLMVVLSPIIAILLVVAAIGYVLHEVFTAFLGDAYADSLSWGEILTVVFASIEFFFTNLPALATQAWLGMQAGFYQFVIALNTGLISLGEWFHDAFDSIWVGVQTFWGNMVNGAALAMVEIERYLLAIKYAHEKTWGLAGADATLAKIKQLNEEKKNLLLAEPEVKHLGSTGISDQLKENSRIVGEELAKILPQLGDITDTNAEGYKNAIEEALNKLNENTAPKAPPGLPPAKPHEFDSPGGGGGGSGQTGSLNRTQEAWDKIMGNMSDPVVQAVKHQTRQQREDARNLLRMWKKMGRTDLDINLVMEFYQ